jgi:DNA-binding NarL/FixJ family response regulator
MKIKVAIVEDNQELLKSLMALVNGAADLECVAACPDGESALAQIPQSQPDVVLMDIRLPKTSGVECVRRLKVVLPQTQMMMLTVFDDYEQIFQSLRAGATGYLLKQSVPEKLCESIRELHAGGSPMSNSIARKVVLAFRKMAAEHPEPGARLSAREQEILEHLARGHLYKEIAGELDLSYHTVRTHVQNIYKKLQIRSKSETVRHVNSPHRPINSPGLDQSRPHDR